MNDLIEKLSNLRSQFNCFNENEREVYHALSGAIKVISERPESCEDAVSRQILLDDLKKLKTAWKKYPVMAKQIEGVEAAIEYVETIPSVTPKQEPCEDAVSREELLSAFPVDDEPTVTKSSLRMTIKHLPSVTPKRKTGKWNFIGDQMFECTECGTCYTQNQFHQMMVRITDPEFPNFCPNCGADMRGEQDG